MEKTRTHLTLFLAFAALTGCLAPGRVTQPTATPAFELNLEADSSDPNGFPMNPHWAYQRSHPGRLPAVESLCGHFRNRNLADSSFLNRCTMQKQAIEFVYPSPAVNWFACTSHGLPSHVNWRTGPSSPLRNAAVVSGRVYLFRHAQIDGDLDLFMRTPGDPARTSRDPVVRGSKVGRDTLGSSLLELEFRLRELEDLMRTGWFGKMVQYIHPPQGGEQNYPQAVNAADGLEAVAIGLYGVDYVHEAHSELHPVLGLVIRTEMKSDREETWAAFARNWGSEGFCAKEVQYLRLPNNVMRLMIPWRRGATAATVTFTGNANLPARRFTHPPISIPVTLPAAERGAVVGEFHVSWEGNVERVALHAPSIDWSKPKDTPEERFEHAWEALSETQRNEIEAAVQAYDKDHPEHRTIEIRMGALKRTRLSVEPRDSVRLAEWCRRAGGSIPGIGRCPREFR